MNFGLPVSILTRPRTHDQLFCAGVILNFWRIYVRTLCHEHKFQSELKCWMVCLFCDAAYFSHRGAWSWNNQYKKISITCRERSKVKFGKLGGGKPKISPTNCEVIILIFFSWLLMHTCYRAGCAWVNIDTGLMELAIQNSQEYSTFKQAKLISKWYEYSTCGVFDFPQMKVLNFEHSFP